MSAMTETKRLQALDRSHYLHPFTDHKELGACGSRIITHAEGIYIWDSEGKRILDGMSGLWCVSLGYGRQELVDAAREQLETLPYYNSFFQCTHPPAVELASRLVDISPEQFTHVFFTGGGSEANDTVLRMVRQYWALQAQPRKQFIISRRNAYHGSTVAAASLGGMQAAHDLGGLPIPGIEHIEQPYWFQLGGAQSPADFGLTMAAQLEEKILELGVDQVAAFIAEPIQGAGGAIMPPDTYWPEIQAICDRYGILLVVDEVITGFGRLGEWFGSTHYGIRPDLMPFAKGVTSGYLPLGGVLISDRVAELLVEKGGEFAHGFTYSGHPVACAVANATLDVLDKVAVIQRVKNQIAPHFSAVWNALADHPLVGEARSTGLIGALELVAQPNSRTRFPKDRKAGTLCRDLAMANGLVMRAVGDTMIIAPPLVITMAQIDEMVAAVKVILDQSAEVLTVAD